MSKKSTYVIWTLVIILVVVASSFIGYKFFNSNNVPRDANEMVSNKIYPIVITTINNPDESSDLIDRITSDTLVQYNYTKNGVVTKTYTKKASYELLNLTYDELKATLDDVKIKQFDSKLVILEKEEITPLDCYIVGSNNGFINIFYKDKANNITLIETTNISTEALPERDLKLLEEGISAKNDAELAKIIEDYTS